MKITNILLLLALLLFGGIASANEVGKIVVKKTPIQIGKLASGPEDDRVGKIYNIYEQDGKFYVAIKYAENDYGMFEAVTIKLKEEPKLEEIK